MNQGVIMHLARIDMFGALGMVIRVFTGLHEEHHASTPHLVGTETDKTHE